MGAIKGVQIGDLVSRSGVFTEPGVVVEKNEDGSVVVDTEPLTISEYHRYLNTSGLSLEEKEAFNTILDQIYANPNDTVRISDIQNEIDRLRSNQGNQNLVRYLKNQQSFLMRKNHSSPRSYQASELSVKK